MTTTPLSSPARLPTAATTPHAAISPSTLAKAVLKTPDWAHYPGQLARRVTVGGEPNRDLRRALERMEGHKASHTLLITDSADRDMTRIRTRGLRPDAEGKIRITPLQSRYSGAGKETKRTYKMHPRNHPTAGTNRLYPVDGPGTLTLPGLAAAEFIRDRLLPTKPASRRALFIGAPTTPSTPATSSGPSTPYAPA